MERSWLILKKNDRAMFPDLFTDNGFGQFVMSRETVIAPRNQSSETILMMQISF